MIQQHLIEQSQISTKKSKHIFGILIAEAFKWNKVCVVFFM
jgi:hypothetical protein